ncbi:MAG: hypothetical protein LC737_01150, partial [Chloroflexi bacterium]|nr:hypothetical protein [Chloroflexota bacterium]
MKFPYGTRVALAALTIILALASALGIALANNLLLNGGFENGFRTQAGIIGVIPNTWTAINEVGNPRYFDSTLERIEGTHSVYMESQDIETPPNPGKPFKVDLYQTVSVVSGTVYA